MLTSMIFKSQLVGTALIVFVKSDLLGIIRNVEATTKKVCYNLSHILLKVSHGDIRPAYEGCLVTKGQWAFDSSITIQTFAFLQPISLLAILISKSAMLIIAQS